MKKKVAVTIAAMLFVLCFAVGGTLAWLIDRTDPVCNTFSYGDINITLSESTGDVYKMIPGNIIQKDPKVTVASDSEACWLFVKIEESANFDTFMTYETADGWTALDGADGVYYREVGATAADTDFYILKDNSVSVKGTVTKEMLCADGFVSPTLTFTAYAVQKDCFETVASAWALANP